MGTRKLAEYIIDIVLLLTGVALVLAAQTIPPGSSIGIGGDFMPKVCSKLWVFLSICLLLWEHSSPDDHVKGITAHVKSWFATLLALTLYVALLDPLGFILSSILYMFAQMCIFVPKEYRDKKHYLLFVVLSILIPLGVDQLFEEVFSLILPAGIL